MENVEIITDVQFEIPELVNLKVAKKQVATFVVNGVPQQEQEVECVIMTCPHCDNILNEFDANISLVDVCKVFANTDRLNLISYCPHCGTKLSYERAVVDEQEGVIVK